MPPPDTMASRMAHVQAEITRLEQLVIPVLDIINRKRNHQQKIIAAAKTEKEKMDAKYTALMWELSIPSSVSYAEKQLEALKAERKVLLSPPKK